MSRVQTGRKISVEHRQRLSDAHKGKKLSTSHKKKISKSLLGNTRCLGNQASIETRIKMSNARIGRTLSAKHKRTLVRVNTGKIHSLATRRKISNVVRLSYVEGRRVPPASASCLHECGWLSTRKAGKLFYRSSWEKAFAELLDANVLVKSFSYQPFGLPYVLNGERHTYFPDFLVELVTGKKFLVELKGGREKDEVVRAKVKTASAYCKRNNIRFWLFRKKVYDIRDLLA